LLQVGFLPLEKHPMWTDFFDNAIFSSIQVKGLCVCQSGYGGAACNETVNNVGVFNPLMDPNRLNPTSSFTLPPSRMGHTFVSCDGESFYLFGGYSVTHGMLGDIWEYSKAANSWKPVTLLSTDNPRPR
jgi:hypothetical protein